MTNEQAIAELQKEHDLIQGEHDLDGSQFAPVLLEALAMAIEVLRCSEIPNCSDCIDRAEAQTAIQFAARRYTVAHEAHGEGHVVWSDNLISVTDAMNALREVPSAQPELIRCKDCRWFGDEGCAILIVDDSDKPKENDFCSFGERKDG